MLLAAASAATLAGCSSPTTQGSDALDPAGFAELVAKPGTVVLDVRTPSEYAEGHLQGAMNIDVNAADFTTRVNQLDKDKAYAVYCRSGNRSGAALKIMKDAGFTQVQHLDGGITAWTSSDRPVVK